MRKSSSHVHMALQALITYTNSTSHHSGNLGAKVYLIFAGCMLVCLVFTFFYFPEVKGRTPAEVDEMFQDRLPARKFKGMFITSHFSRIT